MLKDHFTFFIIPEIPDDQLLNPKRYNVFRKNDYDTIVALVEYEYDGTSFRVRYLVDLERDDQDQLISEAKTLGRWLFKPDF